MEINNWTSSRIDICAVTAVAAGRGQNDPTGGSRVVKLVCVTVICQFAY